MQTKTVYKKSTITISASSKDDIEALLTLCGFPKVFFLLLKLWIPNWQPNQY